MARSGGQHTSNPSVAATQEHPEFQPGQEPVQQPQGKAPLSRQPKARQRCS